MQLSKYVLDFDSLLQVLSCMLYSVVSVHHMCRSSPPLPVVVCLEKSRNPGPAESKQLGPIAPAFRNTLVKYVEKRWLCLGKTISSSVYTPSRKGRNKALEGSKFWNLCRGEPCDMSFHVMVSLEEDIVDLTVAAGTLKLPRRKDTSVLGAGGCNVPSLVPSEHGRRQFYKLAQLWIKRLELRSSGLRVYETRLLTSSVDLPTTTRILTWSRQMIWRRWYHPAVNL